MALRPQPPLGPRSKSSRSVTPLPIHPPDASNPTPGPDPLATALPLNQSHQSHLTDNDAPRYNVPPPILGRPIPRPKTGDKPSLGKLAINGGGIHNFAHLAGPPRIDDVDDGSSTLSPQPRTIRPPDSYNASASASANANVENGASQQRYTHGHGHGHDRTRSGSTGAGPDSGSNQNGYGYSNGNGHSDSVGDLEKAISQVALSSLPDFSTLACPTASRAPPSPPLHSSTSPVPTTSSSVSVSVTAPAPPKPLEFSDSVLEELSRLGEGAGGSVHKVLDKRSSTLYALKTITTRSVSMKQVLRELSIISSSHHPNIVRCFGAYMSPSSSEVKIVMEFCAGGSLEAVGKKIKEVNAVVGEKIAGRLAEGVLSGLAYLHGMKTIHRDVKPSNILISGRGVVKLSDFGVSGELVESNVGTFTGTLIYMAPERVSGGKYTVRSDVWSTGISLLELVQNRFPFTFPTDVPAFEVILTISKGEPPRLEDEPEKGIKWSEEMKDFIRLSLTPTPTTRPTPREMLSHPWIQSMMKQEVRMDRWIRQVWGWPKGSVQRSSSRPNTADSTQEQEQEQESPGSATGPSGA